jgi:5-formyltetrahydrofolate cyclo-ligase
VPGVLFARNGARLGRGGGHYDRLLARAAPGALRIGICYADRLRDALPVDPHDAFVDIIVTELEVLRTGARTPGGDA